MSACGVTVVETAEPAPVPSLLKETGSAVVDDADALLVKEPLAGALTVTVKLVLPPLANEAMLGQVTIPLLLLPPPLALTKDTLKGRVSLTITLEAVDGPTLVTVIV